MGKPRLPNTSGGPASRGQIGLLLAQLGGNGNRNLSTIRYQGWLQNTVPLPPGPYNNTYVYPAPAGSSTEAGFARGGGIFGPQASRGSGSRPFFSRILQPLFCGSQEDSRQMAFYPGFEYPQSGSCENTKVQDGHGRARTTGSEGRRLGNISGFDRCVFPSQSTPCQQEVPAFWHSREGIPVQGVSNGSIAIPRGLYNGGETSQNIPPTERSPYPTVFGRLADFQQQRGPHGNTYSNGGAIGTTLGFSHQYGEIRPHPQTEVSVPGIYVRPDSRVSQSERRQVGEDTELYSSIPAERHTANSPQVAVAVGAVGVNGETSSTRDVARKSSTARATRNVGPEKWQSGTATSSFRPGQGSPDMVDDPSKCLRGSPIGRGTSHPPSFYGCQPRRMGRSPELPYCQGQMEWTGDRPSHQCTGDVSGTESAGAILAIDPEQTRAHMFRQSHHGLLHQEARGNSLARDDESHTQIVCVAGGASSASDCQAYYRQTQCAGRYLVKGRTDYPNRVESLSGSGGEFVANMGQANDRPICDQVQSQDELVLFSNPRPHSNGGGCLVNQLEGVSGVCLPTYSNTEQSAQQGRERGLCRNTGGTVVDETSLVSSIVGVASGFSSTIAVQTEVTKTTTKQRVPRQSSNDASSRLEIVEQALVARGFSEKVAIRMAKAQKGSSLDIYDSKWRGFASWCDQRNANPCEANVCLVADFLCELHEVRKLAVSTIEGYRTAISHTLKALNDSDLGKDPQLSSLIANFARDQSADRVVAPEWDLAFVLGALLEDPFEPLDKAEIKYLTYKTVFLLALATGKRRGEIHAMRRDTVQRQEHWQSVTIFPDASFVAKTQIGCQGGQALQGVTIQSLKDFLSTGMEEDAKLCPVRALRIYLERTDKYRSGRTRLFLSLQKGRRKDISKATISWWLKSTIILCYEQAARELRHLHRVKAHQVRGMAASWALHQNAPIEKIMMACSWKSHTTFTSFYLRDLSSIRGEMFRLGPIVSAQHVH